MTLHVYDTASRELREFVPVRPGQVGIYICGLTTQGEPHIGHVRFAVAFDILRRWLVRGHGYDVTLVRNVTDIDDKILTKAADAGEPWWAWSYIHERATDQALSTLGVEPATYEPRATGHITEMIEMIEALIARGHAYAAQDGSGDVYFDVRSWPHYGELTHQRIEDMEPAADADPRGKRDPRDFALWKGRKESEPETASWPTPFGRGRPGWHLECSAMSRKYMGDQFDIHGGGVDLRFPHHENEQAQSRAAGLGFAQYWMHNAWVTLTGEKMSKSLGNTLTVHELTKTVRPLVLRFYLGSAHYRSTLEFGSDSLQEAQATVERLESFLQRAMEQTTGAQQPATDDVPLPAAFSVALDDDLNVPEALAVVFSTVRQGNRALDEGDASAASRALREVLAMTDILGVNPLSDQWAEEAGAESGHEAALDMLVHDRLHARAQARADRDFATADAIRDQLSGMGIAIEDTPAGARWSWAR